MDCTEAVRDKAAFYDEFGGIVGWIVRRELFYIYFAFIRRIRPVIEFMNPVKCCGVLRHCGASAPFRAATGFKAFYESIFCIVPFIIDLRWRRMKAAKMGRAIPGSERR
jgi:hypothetical protein